MNSNQNNAPKGLHGKYIIHQTSDGSLVDYPCFVLRLDGSDPAAMAAMRAYAEDPACPPELAGDLAVYCAIPAQAQLSDHNEVVKLVKWLKGEAKFYADLLEIEAACNLSRAAVLVEHYQPLQPVAVSERMPGPEDCDTAGRCWWFRPATPILNPYWDFTKEPDFPTHWLPVHALPIPITPLETP